MLEKTGVPTMEDISRIVPSKERLSKGPVAIFECFQRIPCNPCQTTCKNGAVKKSNDINDCPIIDFDLCTGCGICVSKCPGLAVFIVDETYSDSEATIKMPYEFLPLPAVESFVTALDREGKPVCRGKVVNILNTKAQDRTPVITIAVPKEFSMVVRNINVDDYFSDNTIICRCEEITLGEIREYIRKGYTSLDEIKRISRGGMGPCQGRTCRQLIMQEISKATGKSLSEIKMPTFRPPTKPISLGKILGGEKDE